jgi:hypothetical protein
MYAHCRCALLWPVQSLRTGPYTLPPILIFQQLSICILIPLHSHLMLYNITDVLLFSFSFSLSPNSTVTKMFYNWVCIWSCLFCIHIDLWNYLLCIRENMRLLCFWSWLISPNMMRSNCIHIPSYPMSSFLVAEWYSSIYIYKILHDSFTSCRASGLFPELGYCKQCYNEHECTGVFAISRFMFFWLYAQELYHSIVWQFYL